MNEKSLEVLKTKIKDSSVLTEQEKQEWIFLLPKMSDQQLSDLDRLVSIKVSSTSVPKSETELKKPAVTKTPPHPSTPLSSPKPSSPLGESNGVARPFTSKRADKSARYSKPQSPKPKPQQQKEKTSVPAPVQERQKQKEVKAKQSEVSELTFDDLKKAPSVHSFLTDLKKKMMAKVSSQQSTWMKILNDYESSPLYQSYLKSGVLLLSGEKTDGLSHEQFEALTDFHSEIKKAAK